METFTLSAILTGATLDDKDITADIRSWSLSWGIKEYGPNARVSQPLDMILVVKNDASNIWGELGGYRMSQGQQDAPWRAYLYFDNACTFTLTYDGTTKTFDGKLKEIEPIYGELGQREARLIFSDGTFLYRANNSDYGVETDIQEGQACIAGGEADGTKLGDGYPLVFPAVYYTLTAKATGAAKAQAACESAFSYLIDQHNTPEKRRYIRRSARGGDANYDASFNESDMMSFSMRASADNHISRWYFSFHEVEVDSTATNTLWTLNHEITLEAGETKTVKARFNNPDTAAKRVLGESIVTSLVANTHYRMSDAAGDDAGDANGDLTASLTTSNGTDPSDDAEWELTNTGSSTGYVNLLKVIGKGVYIYETEKEAIETVPANVYGPLAGQTSAIKNFAIPYWHSSAFAEELRNLYVNKYGVASRGIHNAEMTYNPNRSAAVAAKFIALDVGNFISVTETIKDLDDMAPTEFYIQNIRVESVNKDIINVTYGLDPLPPQANYIYAASDGTYYDTSDDNGYYARAWIE